jgi:iron complex outermembrane receptor protein
VPFREIEVQAGSFGRKQTNFDLSGPLDADKTLFYRLTGLVRDAKTEISAIKDDRIFIAPALTWKPNEATKLTILAEYMDSTTGGTAAYINEYGPYIDSQGNVLSKATGATKVFGGDKRYNDFRQQQARIGYEFEHKFNEVFTLRQRARFSQLGNNQQYVYIGTPGLTRENTAGFSVDTSLESRFRTGPIDHTAAGRHRFQPPELQEQGSLWRRPARLQPALPVADEPDPDPGRRLCPGPDEVAELAPDRRPAP